MRPAKPNYVETIDYREAQLAMREARPEPCDVDAARVGVDAPIAAAGGTTASPLDALKALIDFAKRAVSGIAQMVAALYDSAILNNPAAFAMVSKPVGHEIDTAGLGVKVATNDGNVPLLVRVQAATSSALSGLPYYLFLADNTNDATYNKAAVIKYEVGASAAVVLPPSKSLYVNGTDPEGGTALRVTVTQVPLRGRAAIFTRG